MPEASDTLLTLSVAASLEHPSKTTHMGGEGSGDVSEGRFIHPVTNSFIQQIFEVLSKPWLFFTNSPTWQNIKKNKQFKHHRWFHYPLPLNKHVSKEWEKQDAWVSFCFPGTLKVGQGFDNSYVWGSAKHDNLVPMKLHIFNKCPCNTYYIPGFMLSAYKFAKWDTVVSTILQMEKLRHR